MRRDGEVGGGGGRDKPCRPMLVRMDRPLIPVALRGVPFRLPCGRPWMRAQRPKSMDWDAARLSRALSTPLGPSFHLRQCDQTKKKEAR